MSEPIRILIVDDHRMVAQGLAESLGGLDDIAVVAMAETAPEAVSAAREHRPDVVLMDYVLPGGDGVEAAAKIREIDPAIKVVMVTSLADERILLQAIQAGCSGYVTKAEAIEDLAATVRAAYEGEALISPSLLGSVLRRLGAPAARAAGDDLTDREREILALIAEGLTNPAIAERLSVSVNTIRKHVSNVLGKLGAHSKLEALVIAAREGLIATI